MKWLTEFIGRAYIQQLEVDQLLDLALINQPDVNFTYCKRAVDDDIEMFARHLVQIGFTGIDQSVTPETLARITNSHLNEVGFHTAGKIKLIQDIIEITLAFIQIIQSERARLILKVVTNDACAKFHTDGYNLRLLCTYLGKGTEWVEDSNVNRAKLINGENEKIIRDFSKIKHTQPFEVAILKGEVGKRPRGLGIVHRSPPITPGQARLLLRLDS